ncbi:YhjD/YihY/BrkB family envelope integrity protein [Actinacidiphila sp. DG2A-62]|jgi:membrane protein|uniref:YhjD/YihY/BrkB family envelope integrity protein n=1 Tax=Actinacidiphila sp. DG2A-62 TaxID=3108821 RepID=UPI002DBE3052|nr:YhjD/YihY/BrkB family envelope integrity protein [Actinacidiphila sp. DG2A-62]MEC3994935.1 YhjD/YihY/BrkB family envelope integrity protein [Actinacidiphila sp. DG2A-62]
MSSLSDAWHRSAIGRLTKQASHIELMHRSMGFAALGFVTLMPLLVVVAAATPWEHRPGFAQWVVDGMGLDATGSHGVRSLFAAPNNVLSATSAWSLASLAYFGLSFVASVETGYRKIWDLPSGPWHRDLRRLVWLAVLTGYLFCESQSAAVLGSGPAPAAVRLVLTFVLGVVFFAWGQWFLLGGGVDVRTALPGAVFTMLGLAGLRVFSHFFFAQLLVSNAGTYGPVGTVLTVVTWLVGVGFVVFGGALLGRHLRDGRMLRQGGEIPQPRRPQEWYEMPEETAPGVRWRSDGAGGAID